MNEFNGDTAGELLVLRVRGMLARAFDERSVVPSPEQWDILLGRKEPTLRDIAEICLELGFYPQMAVFPRSELIMPENEEAPE